MDPLPLRIITVLLNYDTTRLWIPCGFTLVFTHLQCSQIRSHWYWNLNIDWLYPDISNLKRQTWLILVRWEQRWPQSDLSFSWKWSMSPLSMTSGVYPCKWEAVTINHNQCHLVTFVITISGIWWFKLCPISPQNEMISLGRYLKSQKSSPEELDVHLQLQWAPWVPVRSKGEATNVFEVSCCSSIKSHYVSAINQNYIKVWERLDWTG